MDSFGEVLAIGVVVVTRMRMYKRDWDITSLETRSQGMMSPDCSFVIQAFAMMGALAWQVTKK